MACLLDVFREFFFANEKKCGTKGVANVIRFSIYVKAMLKRRARCDVDRFAQYICDNMWHLC